MIKAFIVDDEQMAIEGLKSLLGLFVKDVEVVGESTSVQDAADKLSTLSIDLLFLDISIGSLTGFDLLLSLGDKRNFQTIFVTAHDQHAIKAMRMKALDYLLKPIDPDELIKAIDSFRKLKNEVSKSTAGAVESIKLALPGLSESLVISSEEIEYIVAQKNYSDVILKNGQKHTVSRTLNVFEESLEKAGFLRVHRGYLLNIQHVSSISKSDGGGVIMTSGKYIPIGKSRKEEVLHSLGRHISFV